MTLDDSLKALVRDAMRQALADLGFDPTKQATVASATGVAGSRLYLTVRQAAERTQVSTDTIYRWVKAGLRTGRAGRQLRIASADLDAWLAREGEGTAMTDDDIELKAVEVLRRRRG